MPTLLLQLVGGECFLAQLDVVDCGVIQLDGIVSLNNIYLRKLHKYTKRILLQDLG